MRLYRPHIPLAIRVAVARRQLDAASVTVFANNFGVKLCPAREILAAMLPQLALHLGCVSKDLRLDHDPALALRKFLPRTKRYIPDANDPNFLVYRTKEDHRVKTIIRGDGAQRSDVSRIKRERRRLRKKKREYRWPKGRKIQSCGFDKRKRRMRP